MICNKEFDILTNHLKKHKITSKKYYDTYIKIDIEGICSNLDCSNNTQFRGINYGYAKFCSAKCSANNIQTKTLRENTMLKKYGNTNPSLCSDIVKKRTEKLNNRSVEEKKKTEIKKKETYMNHYGVTHPMKNEKIKRKSQNTNLQKYGNICSTQDKDIRKQIQKIFLEKYDFTHPMKNEDIKKKLSNTVSKKRNPLIKKILLEVYNLELLNEYQNNMTDLELKCNLCGNIYKKNYFNICQGSHPCIVCYPVNIGISKQEKEIVQFIFDIIAPIEIIENSRKIIPPFELDIYIPEKNIAIEFDGLYWHSDECQKGNKNRLYHINKTIECEKKNIQLIHIFEDEWIFKKDIVKARLKQILNVNNSLRIHARKCIIKEIEIQQKNKFLDMYHTQGSDKSSIKLGAFYNNELVSIMTFSKGNISKGSKNIDGVWELNRFCSNYNYHIPGIAGKLLKYFQRTYEWKQIFSYADRRWSQGNLYYNLNFKLDSITVPNYWYIKDFKRIHRFNLRKKENESKDITEIELRRAQGYYRIWDCGSYKFSLEK